MSTQLNLPVTKLILHRICFTSSPFYKHSKIVKQTILWPPSLSLSEFSLFGRMQYQHTLHCEPIWSTSISTFALMAFGKAKMTFWFSFHRWRQTKPDYRTSRPSFFPPAVWPKKVRIFVSSFLSPRDGLEETGNYLCVWWACMHAYCQIWFRCLMFVFCQCPQRNIFYDSLILFLSFFSSFCGKVIVQSLFCTSNWLIFSKGN